MLEWLVQARTTATRDKRLAAVVESAADGVRAYPRPKAG
jgi:hypothetical protein